jgi:hypothetical protein
MTGLVTAVDAYGGANTPRYPHMQQVTQGALRLEEAIVFSNNDRTIYRVGTLDNLHRFLQSAAEWLFYHHRETSIECLKGVWCVEKRRTGNQHGVGLHLRQSLFETSEKPAVFLAGQRARFLQRPLFFVHTRNRGKVRMLRYKVKPMASSSPNPHVNDANGHALSLKK